MRTNKRQTIAILICLIVALSFAIFCGLTYVKHWNASAFWWSWFAIVWVVDLVVGIYLFYKKNCSDELKTFWLFIMIVLPVLGAIISLVFNYKKTSEYGKMIHDHSKLQSALFQAKKSIKIYTNSFFVSNDTFNALNYAIWKGVEVKLIVSVQLKPGRQKFMIMKMDKMLEENVSLHITEKQIEQSFIIIDDENVLYSPYNFNFQNMYSKSVLQTSNNVNDFLKTWENDLERTSFVALNKDKVNVVKKLVFNFYNIFYPFY